MIASAINFVLLALLTVLPAVGGSARDSGSKKDVPEKKIEKKVVVTTGDHGEMVVDSDSDSDDPVVVHVGRRGFLGVRLVEITPELRAHFGAPRDAGVLVGEVDPDTPAAKAGIEVGDVITAVDGERVGWTGDLSSGIRRKKAGETARIDLVRGRASRSVSVQVEETKGERSIDLGDLGDHLRRHAWVMPDLEKTRPLLGDLEGLSRMRKRIAELEKRMSDLEKRLPGR